MLFSERGFVLMLVGEGGEWGARLLLFCVLWEEVIRRRWGGGECLEKKGGQPWGEGRESGGERARKGGGGWGEGEV